MKSMLLCALSSFVGAVLAVYATANFNWEHAVLAAESKLATQALEQRPVQAVAQTRLSAEERINVAVYKNVNHSVVNISTCLLYTSPSPRDLSTSRMPSSA